MIDRNLVQQVIAFGLHRRDEGGRIVGPAFDLQKAVIAAKQRFHSVKCSKFVAFNVDFQGDTMPGDREFVIEAHAGDSKAAAVITDLANVLFPGGRALEWDGAMWSLTAAIRV